jgi:amino acid transporter
MLVLVFSVVTAINVRGVKGGARLNIVSTILKLAPLALLIVVGLANLEPANLAWQSTPSAGDVGRASVFLIFAFAGIESAMVPSGEVREPARTVPRAVLLALGLVTVFYLLVQIATQGILGASLAGRSAPLADAAGVVMGPFGAVLLGSAVVVSTFGYLSGMILAIPRALFAFARDGVLPKALAAVHPRFHTPWVAIIVQSVIALGLAMRNPFEKLAMLANVAALLVYLGCAAASWQLRRKGVRDDASATLKPLPGTAVAPVFATIVIVALLASVTAEEWIVTAIVTAVGIALYFLARFRGATREAGRAA